ARVVIGDEVLEGGVAVDEGDAVYVVYGLEYGLDGLGVLQREVLVYEADDVVLLLKADYHLVDIDREEGEAAHDDQAGDYDCDGGKRHKAMGEYAFAAFHYQIPCFVNLHSCNTRPFRR